MLQNILLFSFHHLHKKYDIAISYAWPHDIIASKVRANKKIAWIHTDYTKLEIDNKLDYNVWNKFDHIASISEEVTKSFIKTYPGLKEKVFLVENIMSPYLINKMASESIEFPESNEDTFKILSVGRLSYVKGFDLAIRALNHLQSKGYQNIKWYIVGYGGYETELKSLIKQFGLEKHFILLGKKTNPYPYIKACDLYVQPSRYEGKAVTVTEAKILGKPILITNYPTSKSQIQNRIDGMICDLNFEEISKTIEMLIKNEHVRNELITKNMKEKLFQYTGIRKTI